MEVLMGVLIVALVVGVIAFVVMRARAQDKVATGQVAASSPRQVAQSRSLNWLAGEAGSVAGKTYHVGQREATLGRKVGNYIQIIDDNVSRVHLKLRGTTAGLEITDAGSDNGTLCNGERLVSGVARQLKDGDRIQLGDNVLVYHHHGNFGTDHGLTEQKIAGTAQHKKTAALGVVSWQAEVQQTLDAAGGDVAEAARQMGVDEAAFRKMMEQAGIGA